MRRPSRKDRRHAELTPQLTLAVAVRDDNAGTLMLKAEGIDPAPNRSAATWADFLRSQADALLSCDFIDTITLTGQRRYILAAIEHSTRRVRILGTTTHPTAGWVAQTARNPCHGP